MNHLLQELKQAFSSLQTGSIKSGSLPDVRRITIKFYTTSDLRQLTARQLGSGWGREL